MTTTLPRNCSRVSGGELNHGPSPSSGGSVPSTGKMSSPILPVRALVSFVAWLAPSLRARPDSRLAVCALDSFERTRVSRPSAIAATPTSTSTPRTWRIRSLAPSDFFIRANSLPPTSKARASEVAAPSA